eukprot:m.527042 g.527042  ORF g.527042 m.527042 type:complete len:258 (+) comp22008_c0_seq6:97-870(+)
MSDGNGKSASHEFHNVGKTWRTREDFSLAYKMQQEEWDVTKSGNINRHQTFSKDLKVAKMSQEEEDLLRKEQERFEDELLLQDKIVSDQLHQSELQELREQNRIAQKDAELAKELQRKENERMRLEKIQQAEQDAVFINSFLRDEIKRSQAAEKQDRAAAKALQREEIRKAQAVRALSAQDQRLAVQLQRDGRPGPGHYDLSESDAEIAAALQLSERKRQLQAEECVRHKEMSHTHHESTLMNPDAPSVSDDEEFDV